MLFEKYLYNVYAGDLSIRSISVDCFPFLVLPVSRFGVKISMRGYIYGHGHRVSLPTKNTTRRAPVVSTPIRWICSKELCIKYQQPPWTRRRSQQPWRVRERALHVVLFSLPLKQDNLFVRSILRVAHQRVGCILASLFSSLSLFLIPHLLLLPPRSPPACFDIEVASGIRAYSTNGWITNTS